MSGESVDVAGTLAWLRPDGVLPGWRPIVESFFAAPAGQTLLARLAGVRASGVAVYPPDPLRILRMVAPEDVRVVILGQDPYHEAGQAEGLAFSVPEGVRPPPSLRNIFKEVARDCGLPPGRPQAGSLVCWARQGVLLLNAVLTVERGRAASHAGFGWESLTEAVVRRVAEGGPAAFLLWGAAAQKRAAGLPSRHLVLAANHPSPLSATRGPKPFIGCGHFSRANAWLRDQGLPGIDWAAAMRPSSQGGSGWDLRA